jgi:phosphomannomutase
MPRDLPREGRILLPHQRLDEGVSDAAHDWDAAVALDRLWDRPARAYVVDDLHAGLLPEHVLGEEGGDEVAGDELARFVDEETAVGIPVERDSEVGALLAESILAKHPGEKVIYDLRASWAVPETVSRLGGVPVVSRVGHAFIKHLMRKEDAVFAGEVSGHYYFRDFSQADSGVVPFLLMLELSSRKGRPLSEILRPYRERYFITGELNTPVPDVPLKLQELKERFGREGRVTHLDGLSVDAEDWHMNVRPSNTEPLLRLNLEARTEELMKAKRDEVLAAIRAS